ncbi:MAG: hypothetical protein HY553_04725 [Elusimicrobia bacterium]|nr:hypothetical protein [Elusimicrobiota bacterium]
MSRFQAMVLAINTSILSVVFAFSAWLYWSTRSEVHAQVEASLARATVMTEALADLKSRELSALAQSMAVSPMLRGALATNDASTIDDVLRTFAAKSGLTDVAVRGRRVCRSDPTWAAGCGWLTGQAPIERGALEVRQNPDKALLDAWTAVTGVRYAVAHPAVDNLPAAERDRYYARESRLAKAGSKITIFAERAPFWRSFESRRNTLVVLGAALFFAGLVLSALFAWLIERAEPAAPGAAGPHIQRLLDEIESARRERRGKPGS